ncbi:exosporium leader peptide-containing protein, partial [Bacillus toyonensis]
MPNKSENYFNKLNSSDFISATAFDSNLIGPTFPPLSPCTLPIGPTGVTGPTG